MTSDASRDTQLRATASPARQGGEAGNNGAQPPQPQGEARPDDKGREECKARRIGDPKGQSPFEIKAVSVDVHGTLILPKQRIGAIYAEFAQRHDIDADADELHSRFFTAFKDQYGRWEIPYGQNDDDAREFWHAVIRTTIGPTTTDALCEELYVAFGSGDTWECLPNSRTALARIRASGLPLIGCTNFDGRVIQLIEDLAIDLDHVVISSHVGKAKPHPAPLQAVAAYAGCRAHELLHIGDSEREDGGAAAAVGCTWLPVDREHGIDLDQLDQLLGTG